MWRSKGSVVAALETVLAEVDDRGVQVQRDGTEYMMLKVTYDGDVLEGERKVGDELSYSVLYQVRTWDILFSNMGVGRGAIGIVCDYCEGFFVSNE